MKHGNSQAGKLPIFRARLQELQGDMSIVAFAEELNLSRQTVGFYLNGDRIPDAVTLLQISEKCNVSADWLLGLAKEPCADQDVRGIMEYTGLSEESVNMLHRVANTEHPKLLVEPCRILNCLLSNPRFSISLLCQISEYIRTYGEWFNQEKVFNQKAHLLDVEYMKTGVSNQKEYEPLLEILWEYEDARDLAFFKATRNFSGLLEIFADDYCATSEENVEGLID